MRKRRFSVDQMIGVLKQGSRLRWEFRFRK